MKDNIFETGDALKKSINSLFVLQDDRFNYLGFATDIMPDDKRKLLEETHEKDNNVHVNIGNCLTRVYCPDLMVSFDIDSSD